MRNSKFDEILCSSFDQLVSGMFTKGRFPDKIDNDKAIQNLGDYIEIYQEKKKLESQKRNLTKIIHNKNLLINKLKNQLKSAREKLDTAVGKDDDKTVLAQMSHEIRTPMSGVSGIVNLLAETELSQEQRQYVNIIKKSSDSLLALVNDILDFSKLSSGNLELNATEFKPAELLSDITDLYRYQAEQKNLKLNWRISPEVPETLIGDAARIKQILTNLTSNAIKFTSKGGIQITVKTRGDQQGDIELLFSVRDTGIGISADQQKRLFQPFTQADPSISSRYGGTGLGLAISKELVGLMKGKIGIRSAIDKGTEIWFTVKVETLEPQLDGVSKDTKPNGQAYTTTHLPEVSKKVLNILLAEDDPVNQVISKIIFNKLGHQVTSVSNGIEVIQALAEKSFDIVFMDLQMPEMDGWQTTSLIRSPETTTINPDIPIVALTASAMKGDEDKCLSAGMTAYLSKPLEINNLTDTLSKIFADRKDDTKPRANSRLGSNTVVDREGLAMMKTELEDKFPVIVRMFVDSLPKKTQNLKKAAQEQDRKRLAEAAHQLKGNSANFYAPQLTSLCHRLEKMATVSSDEMIFKCIESIELESIKVIHELNAAVR